MGKDDHEFDENYQNLLGGSAAENARAILDHRAALYADPEHVNTNLGLMWTALIQQYYGITLPKPIPAELVFAMMTGQKLCRCMLNPDHKDTRLDIHGYATLLTDQLERLDQRRERDVESEVDRPHGQSDGDVVLPVEGGARSFLSGPRCDAEGFPAASPAGGDE